MGQFIEGQWLPSIQTTIRATTFAMYEINTRTHIIPALGSVQLRTLTPTRLNALYAYLLTDGRRDGRGGLSARVPSVSCTSSFIERSRDAVRSGTRRTQHRGTRRPAHGEDKGGPSLGPRGASTLLDSCRDRPVSRHVPARCVDRNAPGRDSRAPLVRSRPRSRTWAAPASHKRSSLSPTHWPSRSRRRMRASALWHSIPRPSAH